MPADLQLDAELICEFVDPLDKGQTLASLDDEGMQLAFDFTLQNSKLEADLPELGRRLVEETLREPHAFG